MRLLNSEIERQDRIKYKFNDDNRLMCSSSFAVVFIYIADQKQITQLFSQ